MSKPTQLTLRDNRAMGRLIEICERWQINPKVPGGGYRKDLFGFLDMIALDPDEGIIGIQSCGQSFAAHLKTMVDSEMVTPNVIKWLTSPSKPKLELWGWRKLKLKRGGKALRWCPRIKVITMEDIN